MGKASILLPFVLVAAFFGQSTAFDPADYICGDANGDGGLNVGDAVFMINYIFRSGPAPESDCCAICSDGETEPCYYGPPETNGIGECHSGTRTCVGGFWGPCEGSVLPQTEICDGLDNDCDGIPDNGDPGGGGLCDTGEPGVCRYGVLHCQGGALVCVPDESPSPELCDGLDNDCDGLIDEGFHIGEPCTVGMGACQSWGVIVCALDGHGTWAECGAVAGSPSPEICDGLDNDCDGLIDEGFNVGEPCNVGQSECKAYGVMVCTIDGSGTECSAMAGSPSPEICDGLDNDCDGIIDEGFNVGEPCNVGQGECKAYGVMVCTVDGSGTECSAVAGSPSTEICDGLDNDCDGLIDEGFNVGEPCNVGQGECKAYGVMVCTINGSGTECSAVAGSPSAEICDGLDNDCDGVIDNGYDVGEPCSAGQGACQSLGVKVCTMDGLGTECNAVAGTPSPEICDDYIDNDCDGLIDGNDPDCQ